MRITIIHKLNERGPDEVFAPMVSYNEALKVVTFLNQKAVEVAKAEYGADWEEYANHYFAKEYVVPSSEDIISAIE